MAESLRVLVLLVGLLSAGARAQTYTSSATAFVNCPSNQGGAVSDGRAGATDWDGTGAAGIPRALGNLAATNQVILAAVNDSTFTTSCTDYGFSIPAEASPSVVGIAGRVIGFADTAEVKFAEVDLVGGFGSAGAPITTKDDWQNATFGTASTILGGYTGITTANVQNAAFGWELWGINDGPGTNAAVSIQGMQMNVVWQLAVSYSGITPTNGPSGTQISFTSPTNIPAGGLASFHGFSGATPVCRWNSGSVSDTAVTFAGSTPQCDSPAGLSGAVDVELSLDGTIFGSAVTYTFPTASTTGASGGSGASTTGASTGTPATTTGDPTTATTTGQQTTTATTTTTTSTTSTSTTSTSSSASATSATSATGAASSSNAASSDGLTLIIIIVVVVGVLCLVLVLGIVFFMMRRGGGGGGGDKRAEKQKMSSLEESDDMMAGDEVGDPSVQVYDDLDNVRDAIDAASSDDGEGSSSGSVVYA